MLKNTKIRYSLSDRAFLFCDFLILLFLLIVVAYPLIFIVGASFSGGAATLSLSPIPKSPTIEGYRAVFNYRWIWVGYLNSLIYMVVGTALALGVTICCAYPLSRPNLPGGKVAMGLCIFTMYFSGGLIPTYLTVRSLGLIDSGWSVMLMGSLSIYNMIVMRTFFKNQIPLELYEAASLDGCGDTRFLLRIVLPLSAPIIAVIGLYYAVGFWNSYFNFMIYIQSREKFPLTVFLREILIINSANDLETSMDLDQIADMETRRNIMKYAIIVVSCLPVMLLYPFIQRYFVRGVMIGSVKG